jgi:two-component system, OmpR family, aerobic respiration control sensor histidine kinase ArcB
MSEKINKLRSNLSYSEVIRKLPQNVYLKDADGRILECSDEQAHAVGLKSASEIIGKTDYDLFSKDQADSITKIDQQVIKYGDPACIEEVSTRADGTIVFYLSHKIPLKDDKGKIIGLLGVSVDITQRKEAEDELKKTKELLDQSNQIKSRLLKVLQHDIRNKLTGVLTFADLLLEYPDRKYRKDWIKLVGESAEDILPALDRISHYLSLETGSLKPYDSPFHLEKLLQSLVNKYQEEISKKKLTLIYELDPELEGYFIGDYSLTYEILDHLVFNAIYHTPSGKKVEFMAKFIHQRGQKVELDILVHDQGSGIPKKNQSGILGLFEAAPKKKDHYTKPSIHLSVSKKIAQILGGDLTLESWENKGTEFTLNLNLKRFKQAVETESRSGKVYASVRAELIDEEEDALLKLDQGKPLILVVEDEASNVEALKTIFALYFDCDTLFADTLEQAKGIVEQGKPIDLIFLDVGLPDGEGYDLIDTIYDIYSKKGHYPYIVAITAYARDVDIDHFREKGLIDVLPKPITPQLIQEVMVALYGEEVRKKGK